MPSPSPTSPIKAHHRLMRYILSKYKTKVDPTPEQLDKVSRVFRRAGGSWEGVFQGSVKDIDLLKRTLVVAVKAGVFTKA